jgi:hypothetical protein
MSRYTIDIKNNSTFRVHSVGHLSFLQPASKRTPGYYGRDGRTGWGEENRKARARECNARAKEEKIKRRRETKNGSPKSLRSSSGCAGL